MSGVVVSGVMTPGEFIDILILLGILLMYYRNRQRWREYEKQMGRILELVKEVEEKLVEKVRREKEMK